MKRFSLIIFLAAIFGWCAAPSFAAPIPYMTSVGKIGLLDEGSGLTWLNLEASTGPSSEFDVPGYGYSFGGYFSSNYYKNLAGAGFRLATASELLRFINGAGVPLSRFPYEAHGQNQELISLMDLWGSPKTVVNGGPGLSLQFVYADENIQRTLVGTLLQLAPENGDFWGVERTSVQDQGPFQRFALVSAEDLAVGVPIPPPYMLLVLGMSVLFLVRSMQRANPARIVQSGGSAGRQKATLIARQQLINPNARGYPRRRSPPKE